MRPLLGAVRDRSLVVVPSPALQSVVWSALPSCIGRAVTVSPSASLWHRAAIGLQREPTGNAVCVAGPGLPGGREEATRVAGLYASSSLLVDGAATCEGVLGRIFMWTAIIAGAGFGFWLIILEGPGSTVLPSS